MEENRERNIAEIMFEFLGVSRLFNVHYEAHKKMGLFYNGGHDQLIKYGPVKSIESILEKIWDGNGGYSQLFEKTPINGDEGNKKHLRPQPDEKEKHFGEILRTVLHQAKAVMEWGYTLAIYKGFRVTPDKAEDIEYLVHKMERLYNETRRLLSPSHIEDYNKALKSLLDYRTILNRNLEKKITSLEKKKGKKIRDTNEVEKRETKEFIIGTRSALETGLNDMHILFEHGVRAISDLMKSKYKDSWYLARKIVQDKELVGGVYGEREYHKLLNKRYKFGAAEANFIAGMSHLSGGRCEEAKIYFDEAKKLKNDIIGSVLSQQKYKRNGKFIYFLLKYSDTIANRETVVREIMQNLHGGIGKAYKIAKEYKPLPPNGQII